MSQDSSNDASTDQGQTDSSKSTVTRRVALAGLASLGLLSSVETAGATAANTLEYGETATGSADPGLKIVTDASNSKALIGEVTNTGNDFDIGVEGRTAAKKGRGVAGYANNSTGNSIGLLGRNNSEDGTGLDGFADNATGNTVGVRGRVNSAGGRGVFGKNKATSGTAYGVYGVSQSSNGYGLFTPDDAKVGGVMEVGSDLVVTGTKNFAQAVTTDTGPKQVKYTAVEAGRAHTETNDIAEMENGVAVIDLPDHFDMVTSSEEQLTVQVTPYADEKVHPQVTDRSTERIVVKDFGDGYDEYTFAYTVKGIRKGFEDEQVVSNL